MPERSSTSRRGETNEDLVAEPAFGVASGGFTPKNHAMKPEPHGSIPDSQARQVSPVEVRIVQLVLQARGARMGALPAAWNLGFLDPGTSQASHKRRAFLWGMLDLTHHGKIGPFWSPSLAHLIARPNDKATKPSTAWPS